MVSTRALETAYLHEFWTFLVLGGRGAFLGFFGGLKNTPLDVSVLDGPGGLGSELVEMAEPERTRTGGTGFGTGTVGTGTGSCRNEPNRTEPNRGLPEVWTLDRSK